MLTIAGSVLLLVLLLAGGGLLMLVRAGALTSMRTEFARILAILFAVALSLLLAGRFLGSG